RRVGDEHSGGRVPQTTQRQYFGSGAGDPRICAGEKMSITLALDLAEIALELASQGDGPIQAAKEVASSLLGIIDKGIQAYRDHTGEPISLNLIKAETEI